MARLQGELFIWSAQKQLVNDTPTGIHQYHEKDVVSHHFYMNEQQLYHESRDVAWVLKNKRPEKLRETLKELEELLTAHKCVTVRWRTRRLVQILLSNGLLASVVLSAHCGDIEKIFMDKTLLGKLTSERVSDALITDSYLVLSYQDTSKLDYIYLSKKLPTGDAIKKMEKLGSYEPKYGQIDLPGPQTTRRLDRKLALSASEDLILCWWPISSQEAWPWAPMSNERERCNVVLLNVNGAKLEVLTYVRTENDPFSVKFSRIQPNLIHIVEKIASSGNQQPVEIGTYEVNKNRIQKLNGAIIPLKSPLIQSCRNPSEDRVILATENGTLVLYDEDKKVTQTEQIAVPPNHLSWHPDGALVFVSSSRGDIQLLDLALNVIPIQLQGEKDVAVKTVRLAQYFRTPPVLNALTWCPCEVTQADYMNDSVDTLFLVFAHGPLAVFQLPLGVHSPNSLTTTQIINQYLQRRQLDEAVNLLCSLNWNTEPQTCYHGLMAIMVHLLRLPLNVVREAQLESTLGTFYAPNRALSESIVLEYRDPISRLARRFFHHLLRYQRFDKAYLLAVDIGQADLFSDMYHLAKDKGENVLAEVARRKADHLHEQNAGSTESLSSLDSGSQGSLAESPGQEYYEETDLDEPYAEDVPRSVQGSLAESPGQEYYEETDLDEPYAEDVPRSVQV